MDYFYWSHEIAMRKLEYKFHILLRQEYKTREVHNIKEEFF